MPEFVFDPQALRALCRASGLKLEAIALGAGRGSKETLQSWLAGRTAPNSVALGKLCQVLACSPQDLVRPIDRVAEVAERHAVRSRRRQGLPAKVTDPAALDDGAKLLKPRAS